MSNQGERVSDWITAREWVTRRGGKLFSTFASLEWFVRQHRAELIRSGEYIVRRGNAGSLVGPGFDRVVLEILRKESARTIEGEAA
jgi:hypothetical protein